MLIDWSRTSITYVGIRNLISYEGVLEGAGTPAVETGGGGYATIIHMRRRRRREGGFLRLFLGWLRR